MNQTFKVLIWILICSRTIKIINKEKRTPGLT